MLKKTKYQQHSYRPYLAFYGVLIVVGIIYLIINSGIPTTHGINYTVVVGIPFTTVIDTWSHLVKYISFVTIVSNSIKKSEEKCLRMFYLANMSKCQLSQQWWQYNAYTLNPEFVSVTHVTL